MASTATCTSCPRAPSSRRKPYATRPSPWDRWSVSSDEGWATKIRCAKGWIIAQPWGSDAPRRSPGAFATLPGPCRPQDHPTSSYGLESAEPQSTSLLATLRRRALIVVVTVLLVGGAAAAIGFLKGDVYQSTSKLLFSQTIGPELNATGLLPTSLDADNLAQDNVAAVDSHNVARATARRLGDDTSVDDLAEGRGRHRHDEGRHRQHHRLVELARARRAAVHDLGQRRGRRRRARRDAPRAAGPRQPQRPDQRPVGRRRATAARATACGRWPSASSVLAQTGTGAATVIQSGVVPTTKSGNPVRTIILGLLFGLVLGVGLALLREQADSRLHRPDEVSAAFDAPVLTTVPRNRALKRHVPFPDLPPEVAEAYRMLQANLRYGRGDRVRTVLVTSARSQEGKTTTSWYLAAAAASAGLSVALVEADLRRPTIAARYGLRPDYGLVEVLRGELDRGRGAAAGRRPARRRRRPDRRPGVQVLVAGDVPRRPVRAPAVATGSASCSRCSSSATTSSWSTRRRCRTSPTPSASCATSRACWSPRR